MGPRKWCYAVHINRGIYYGIDKSLASLEICHIQGIRTSCLCIEPWKEIPLFGGKLGLRGVGLPPFGPRHNLLVEVCDLPHSKPLSQPQTPLNAQTYYAPGFVRGRLNFGGLYNYVEVNPASKIYYHYSNKFVVIFVIWAFDNSHCMFILWMMRSDYGCIISVTVNYA